MNEIQYIENQFAKLGDSYLQIKICSEGNKSTNFLNISKDELEKIKELLIESRG